MLVDLAGSERLKDTYRDRHETATINKSLFCLGKVLTALAERSDASGVYVPYRDSVLTKLLKPGLDPPALTLMITCCSPCDVHIEETLNTLFYAQKATGIVQPVPVVEDTKPKSEIVALRGEVRELRRRNTELEMQLQAKQGAALSGLTRLAPTARREAPSLVLPSEDDVNNAAWETRWEAPRNAVPRFGGAGGDSVFDELEVLKTKLRSLESKFSHAPSRPEPQGVIFVNPRWTRL